jgi:hypothetical protein
MAAAEDIQRLREAVATINLRIDQATEAQAATLKMVASQEVERLVAGRLITEAERELLRDIAAERARWAARREVLLQHVMKGGAWGLAVLAAAMWWDSLKAMVTGRAPTGG